MMVMLLFFVATLDKILLCFLKKARSRQSHCASHVARTFISAFHHQSRSQSPRSSVGGIMGLWEKAQKYARNSLHSITIGSSTPGKRAIFKRLNDGALARS